MRTNLRLCLLPAKWEHVVPTYTQRGQQTAVGQDWPLLKCHLKVRHFFLASRIGKDVAHILSHVDAVCVHVSLAGQRGAQHACGTTEAGVNQRSLHMPRRAETEKLKSAIREP